MDKRQFSRLVNAEKSKLTDKEIFFSPDYQQYLQNIADNISGKYGRGANVKLSFTNNDETACTDGDDIYINVKNPITTRLKKASRAERNLSYIGLLGHEAAHILFTDFTVLRKVSNSVQRGELYPALPDKDEFPAQYHKNYEEIIDTLAEKNPRSLKIILTILQRLQNTVEDGYIERLMSRKFPGSIKRGLDINNNAMEGQSISVKKMLKNGVEPLAVICNSLLFYCKGFPEVINPERTTGNIIDVINEIENLADQTLDENDPVIRMHNTNCMLVYVWKYVKPMLDTPSETEESSDESNEQSGSGNGQPENESSNGSSDSEKNKQSGNGKSQSGEQNSNGGSDSEENKQSGNGKSQSGEQNSNGGSDSEGNKQSERGNSQSGEQNSNGNSNFKGNMQSGSGDGQSEEQKSGNTAEDIEKKFLDELSSQSQMPTGRNSTPVAVNSSGKNFSETEEAAESSLKKLESELATEKVENKLENDLSKELKLQAKNEGTVKYKVNVHRQKTVSDSQKIRYNILMKELTPVSKALQKRMLTVLKDRKKSATERGLYMGTRLDSTAYARTDLKVFTKRNRPNDELSLAVALLIDESGSMCGEKIKRARQTALVVYDFCSSLGIPVAIYGHSTSGYQDDVDMYAYADYDSVDGNDKYRLTEISDRGCNRDGAAIRFVIKRLEKRSETKRLFIIISDGQPYAEGGYYGKTAFDDLHAVKKEYERKGIIFFTAAIDSDKEAIKRCYGERSFLDLSDLNKLPLAITKLIAKHI